jgi:hypothetical protein
VDTDLEGVLAYLEVLFQYSPEEETTKNFIRIASNMPRIRQGTV